MGRGNSVAELNISDVSLLMAEIEAAVVSYTMQPRSSLERSRSLLGRLEEECQFAFSSTSLFHSQLILIQNTIDQLLGLDCPFHTDWQTLFLPCLDAIFQNVMAVQLGPEYQQLHVRSLLPHNSYWQSLIDFQARLSDPADRFQYVAELTGEKSFDIEGLLQRLVEFGSVSFEVSGTVNGCFVGRFSFETSVPLSWLDRFFSELEWVENKAEQTDKQTAISDFQVSENLTKTVSTNDLVGQTALLEHLALSFPALLSVFQSNNLSRHWRDSFLTQYTQHVQQQIYTTFADVVGNMAQVDPAFSQFPVPRVNLSSWSVEQESMLFPTRWQGSFYALAHNVSASDTSAVVESDAVTATKTITQSVYLGRDILPSVLYQIDYLSQQLHFHCSEARPYCIEADQISFTNQQAFCCLEDERRVPLVTSLEVYSIDQAACKLFPNHGKIDVLVVTQLGQPFAIPYDMLRCVEAVALDCHCVGPQVRNIWLDKKGEMLLEPSLANASIMPPLERGLRAEMVPRLGKKGYYFGLCNGLPLAIEADLVEDITPYKLPQCFNLYTEFGLQSRYFMPSLESCVEYVELNKGASGFSETSSTGCFSVILEADGKSVVLPFVSVDWYESYQSIESLELGSGSELSNDLEHEDLVVLDKKKYLSFITDYFASVLACK